VLIRLTKNTYILMFQQDINLDGKMQSILHHLPKFVLQVI